MSAISLFYMSCGVEARLAWKRAQQSEAPEPASAALPAPQAFPSSALFTPVGSETNPGALMAAASSSGAEALQ